MIPKKIHYLWMSEKKNETVLRCLQSWREHLEGYEIVEWNASNFPYQDFLYAREAYSRKKWAFVTDYFRLWVLDKFGGIRNLPTRLRLTPLVLNRGTLL